MHGIDVDSAGINGYDRKCSINTKCHIYVNDYYQYWSSTSIKVNVNQVSSLVVNCWDHLATSKCW